MVTILSVGFTSPTRIEQERTIASLKWTEQAPHCAMPQPYFVPVSPTCSRITHNRGVSSSTCKSRTVPLMLSFAMSVPLRRRLGGESCSVERFVGGAGHTECLLAGTIAQPPGPAYRGVAVGSQELSGRRSVMPGFFYGATDGPLRFLPTSAGTVRRLEGERRDFL